MGGRIAGFIAGVTVAALIGAAAVTAAVGVPDSNGVIHACLATETGQVRIVAEDSQCRMNEAALSWNQEGPEGKQGPAGESAHLDPLVQEMVTLETRVETLEDRLAALAIRVDELTGDDPVTDTDGDGYPDESDVCPNVPHTADLDADCIPDELDSDPNFPPDCDDGDPLTIDVWDGVNGTCVHALP